VMGWRSWWLWQSAWVLRFTQDDGRFFD
jgi:hypothetical protein